MTTTVKRITLSLTREQERQLKILCDISGENKSQIIHNLIFKEFLWKCPNDLRTVIPYQEDNAK
jgi:hypothetical protein